jgi:hypothetical protein
MQVEVVDAVEHRYVHPLRAPNDEKIEELIPGRGQFTLVLQFPDGTRALAEVTEDVFNKFRSPA